MTDVSPGIAELRQEMFGQIHACYVSASISAAAQLRLADLICVQPRRPEEVADITGTNPGAVYRLLRALASVGVFTELDDGRFAGTPKAELIRSDIPGSLHAIAVMMGSELQWPSLGDLTHTIRTGQPAFEHVFGTSVWEYLAGHQEARQLFHQAMTSVSETDASAILDAYDFTQAGQVVDIGGGQGTLLAAILRRYPALHGVLYDQPEVMDEARALFMRQGVADRATAAAGDMLTHIPPGAGTYLMKTVLHDWDDDRARQLLASCRKAMDRKSRLLVISRLVQPGNGPDSAKFQDLNMLIHLGGAERTAAETDNLLKVSGLRIARIIPTQSPLSIVECLTRES